MADPYTQLLEWRRSEATARGLAKLPNDFYLSTQRYLAETRATFEGELRSNPSSRKGELARQTYQRAHQLARDIVEARTRKVLDLAFQAALGGTKELPNALPEDRGLFDRFLDSVRAHRGAVAPYLDGTAAPSAPLPLPAAPPSAPGAPPPPVAAAASALPAPIYVRILKDGRPIALGQETVELRKEDVVSLPEEAAKLLVDAGVAERIRTAPVRPTVT